MGLRKDKLWCMASEYGKVLLHGTFDSCTMAIQDFVKRTHQDWCKLYCDGYRAVRVRIVPEYGARIKAKG